jgi:hypothetical protein
MIGFWLILCLVVLGLNFGSCHLAWSQNPQTGQDEDNSFQVLDKDQEGSVPKDQYQFFSPVKPNGAGNFLIIDPDGKTASDYRKFLTPLDQIDKKSER